MTTATVGGLSSYEEWDPWKLIRWYLHEFRSWALTAPFSYPTGFASGSGLNGDDEHDADTWEPEEFALAHLVVAIDQFLLHYPDDFEVEIGPPNPVEADPYHSLYESPLPVIAYKHLYEILSWTIDRYLREPLSQNNTVRLENIFRAFSIWGNIGSAWAHWPISPFNIPSSIEDFDLAQLGRRNLNSGILGQFIQWIYTVNSAYAAQLNEASHLSSSSYLRWKNKSQADSQARPNLEGIREFFFNHRNLARINKVVRGDEDYPSQFDLTMKHRLPRLLGILAIDDLTQFDESPEFSALCDQIFALESFIGRIYDEASPLLSEYWNWCDNQNLSYIPGMDLDQLQYHGDLSNDSIDYLNRYLEFYLEKNFEDASATELGPLQTLACLCFAPGLWRASGLSIDPASSRSQVRSEILSLQLEVGEEDESSFTSRELDLLERATILLSKVEHLARSMMGQNDGPYFDKDTWSQFGSQFGTDTSLAPSARSGRARALQTDLHDLIDSVADLSAQLLQRAIPLSVDEMVGVIDRYTDNLTSPLESDGAIPWSSKREISQWLCQLGFPVEKAEDIADAVFNRTIAETSSLKLEYAVRGRHRGESGTRLNSESTALHPRIRLRNQCENLRILHLQVCEGLEGLGLLSSAARSAFREGLAQQVHILYRDYISNLADSMLIGDLVVESDFFDLDSVYASEWYGFPWKEDAE